MSSQLKNTRYNVYLRDEANRAIEILFTRLQEAGEIPRNAVIADVGQYRALIITYALLQAVKDCNLATD